MMTKEEMKAIKSFFYGIENTRGYDLYSELGEIADTAYHHWVNVERKDSKIKLLNEEISIMEEGERRHRKKISELVELVGTLRYEIRKLKEYINELAIKVIHWRKK